MLFSTEGNLSTYINTFKCNPPPFLVHWRSPSYLCRAVSKTELWQQGLCLPFLSYCLWERIWLAFVPGSWETLNPWNFTTDCSLYYPQWTPGTRLLYKRVTPRWPLISRRGGHAGKANQVIRGLALSHTPSAWPPGRGVCRWNSALWSMIQSIVPM